MLNAYGTANGCLTEFPASAGPKAAVKVKAKELLAQMRAGARAELIPVMGSSIEPTIKSPAALIRAK